MNMKVTHDYSMKIVSAHNVTGEVRDLVGVTGKCFKDLFRYLREGDHAVVEVEGRGYKTIGMIALAQVPE